MILDDVRELLRQGRGDPRLLERVRRAAEQGEVISVYERQYVEGLVAKYIRPEHDAPAPPPPTFRASTYDTPARAAPGKRPAARAGRGRAMPARLRPSKKVAVIIVVLAAALSVVMAAGTGLIAIDIPIPDGIGAGTEPAAQGLTVEPDSASYSSGDIISISGSSDSGGDVMLSISNAGGQEVWTEAVQPKPDGTYSTLSIAGGTGWEMGGQYTLEAAQGDATTTAVFGFRI